MTTYRFFDRLLDSAVALPELPAAGSHEDDPHRIEVALADDLGLGSADARALAAPTDEPDGGDTFLSARVADGFLLRFPGLADFRVEPERRRVVGCPHPATPPETLRHLLLDHVLARLIGQSGRLVVHASAYVEDGTAVAFVGRSGWGKSTLAASFHGGPRRLLGDDCLLLDPRPSEATTTVVPSYAGVRLWPDTADTLFGHLPELGPVAHDSPKKRLVVPGAGADEAAAPTLGALFLINDPHADPAATIAIEPLRGAAAVMALVGRTFLIDAEDMDTVAALLGRATEVLRRGATLRTLRYPRDLSRLSEVRAAVLTSLGA